MRALIIFGMVLSGGIGNTLVVGQDEALEREQNRIQMLRRISPSVVCVMPPNGQGGGSGVLISSDGFAISNYHVTSGAGNFMKCGLNDGKIYDSVIVGIRVQVGSQALERIPTFFEVFGRYAKNKYP